MNKILRKNLIHSGYQKLSSKYKNITIYIEKESCILYYLDEGKKLWAQYKNQKHQKSPKTT